MINLNMGYMIYIYIYGIYDIYIYIYDIYIYDIYIYDIYIYDIYMIYIYIYIYMNWCHNWIVATNLVVKPTISRPPISPEMGATKP